MSLPYPLQPCDCASPAYLGMGTGSNATFWSMRCGRCGKVVSSGTRTDFQTPVRAPDEGGAEKP